jgi:hypothetical protein
MSELMAMLRHPMNVLSKILPFSSYISSIPSSHRPAAVLHPPRLSKCYIWSLPLVLSNGLAFKSDKFPSSHMRNATDVYIGQQRWLRCHARVADRVRTAGVVSSDEHVSKDYRTSCCHLHALRQCPFGKHKENSQISRLN